MEIIPPYLRIYQQILKDLENALPFHNEPKAKAGRIPKLTDIHIAAIFILYYITNTKVLTENTHTSFPSTTRLESFGTLRNGKAFSRSLRICR